LTLLLLAAVDEGIGAAFVGGADADDLRNLLGIPAAYIPVGIALLGHEAPDAKQWGDVASASRRPRRPYDEVVHHDRW
jgi:nitroreductase